MMKKNYTEETRKFADPESWKDDRFRLRFSEPENSLGLRNRKRRSK